MTLTILAAVFLAIILLITFVGFKGVIKQGTSIDELNMERCTICRKKFNRVLLVERQIGDHTLLFFCPSCINGLHSELTTKD